MTASGTPPFNYQWFFNLLTPLGSNSASLNLTSLAVFNSGNYTVVISNSVGSVTSAVAVLAVTNPPLPGATIRIEAENYADMFGIQTQATADVGGGQNIGFIQNGDWADYTVNLPVAGNYVAAFRVASGGGGGSIIVMTGGNTNGTAIVPGTGGWQNWTTISPNISFPQAGVQNLRLNFVGGTGYLYNLNWLDLTPLVSMLPVATNLVASVFNNQLVLTWPNGVGWQLQMQTNAVGMGLGTNWINIGGAISPYTNIIDPAISTTFYRLVSP